MNESATGGFAEHSDRAAVRGISPDREIAYTLDVRASTKDERLLRFYSLPRGASSDNSESSESESDEERPVLQRSNLARKQRDS